MKAKSELDGNIETPAETTGGGPILDVGGQPIDPIWAAEFRGFLWGEGSLAVSCGQPDARRYPQWHSRRHSIAITVTIGLRSDDSAVLLEFQRRLGGKIRTEHYRGKNGERTITRWQLGTAANNLRVVALLRSPTELRFAKARQLDLWEEALRLKIKAGATAASRYSDADHARMLAIGQELVRLRSWTG